MTKNTKTIAEMFAQIRDNYNLTAEEIEFLNGRIDICNRKNSKKSGELTETQKENQALAEDILSYMASCNGNVTIAQIRKHFDLSPQKVTPIMTSLVNDNKLTKTVEKRVSYFNLVEE